MEGCYIAVAAMRVVHVDVVDVDEADHEVLDYPLDTD